VEIEGLDGPEMGTLGYPDFQIHPGTLGAAAPAVAMSGATATSAAAVRVNKPVLD
jgi:hypothetical protein